MSIPYVEGYRERREVASGGTEKAEPRAGPRESATATSRRCNNRSRPSVDARTVECTPPVSAARLAMRRRGQRWNRLFYPYGVGSAKNEPTAQHSASRIATQTACPSASIARTAFPTPKDFAEVPPPSPSPRPVTLCCGPRRRQRREGRRPFVEPERRSRSTW